MASHIVRNEREDEDDDGPSRDPIWPPKAGSFLDRECARLSGAIPESKDENLDIYTAADQAAKIFSQISGTSRKGQEQIVQFFATRNGHLSAGQKAMLPAHWPVGQPVFHG